jgi:hypothetical protein
MNLTTEQVKEIAELEVRRYFDHYQTEIFPVQLKTIIEAHDNDDEAHGSVRLRVDRAVWVFIGVAIASGGTGAFLAKVMAAVGH